MRILHLTLSFTEGGRRRAITSLLQGLRGAGISCRLCCLEELGCAPEELRERVEAFEALRRRSLFDLSALSRLRSFCKDHAVDVIHAHDSASQFTAALLRLSLSRPRLLMTFHRTLDIDTAAPADRLRNAFANALSGAIITGSVDRRDHFLRRNLVSPGKVVRIPFGVDTGLFRPDPEDRAALRREMGLGPEVTVVGAAGHFGPEKGIDRVLRAWLTLARKHPSHPVALVVLGDGNEKQREVMRQLASAAPDRVIFAGFRRDVDRWFRALDLFVHAPRMEAFGLVLCEAMATGLPVVATGVGGIPDIVRDGQTGLLLEDGEPATLASGILKLVWDSDRRLAMGAQARRVAVREYGIELYAQRHLRLYRALLAGEPPVAAGVENPANWPGFLSATG